MKVILHPQVSPITANCCVTIGNFDGVHKGHQQLIEKVIKQAKSQHCLSAVVTMMPLPQQYFSGKFAVDLLSDFKLKARLFKKMGLDIMCVLSFNEYLADMQADDFY
ncbi:MAG: adenylyltransferase/cytidyltransferase family protein, partial [Xanthomonadales bacterium]|nr:adenylyltransferase/cytidyltransferase family protein [Xanthomonadales bacterium]